MSEISQFADVEKEEPVISIQPDWEDSLFTAKNEVWISCKFRGKDSIHSMLRFHGGTSFTSDDFTVTGFKRNGISLRHDKSGFCCTFVPPCQTFSSVHSKKVVWLDVNDDGNLGVSVCSDNNLIVWNAKTGETLRTFVGHVANVYKCKFFPSGVVVLSGGSDMQLKIWCAKTTVCPVTLVGHTGPVNDFCIVEKGKNVISVSSDGTARLWYCAKGETIGIILESSDVLNCCAIGILEDSGTESGWEENERNTEFGTKDKILVVGSEQGFVYGVAIYDRKILFKLNLNSAVNVIILSGDKFVSGCHNGNVTVHKFRGDDVKSLRTYYESNSPALSGCVFNEKSFFIGRNDGTVSCFQFEGNSDTRIRLTGPDCDPVYSISSTKNEVYTACRDSKIRKYIIDIA